MLRTLLILIAGAAIPAWIARVSAHPPQTRDIHIEAYRYGFSPSRIAVNRGDRLRLTFSTRDTGQSFFFQDYAAEEVREAPRLLPDYTEAPAWCERWKSPGRAEETPSLPPPPGLFQYLSEVPMAYAVG
jgi:hypothetical protein